MESFDLNKAKNYLLEETSEEPKMYTVYFTYGEDDNDDVDIEASSPKGAVALVKSDILKKYKKARGFIGRIKQDL
jgi:hypothetical protein